MSTDYRSMTELRTWLDILSVVFMIYEYDICMICTRRHDMKLYPPLNDYTCHPQERSTGDSNDTFLKIIRHCGLIGAIGLDAVARSAGCELDS